MTDRANPLLTIVTPTYNRAGYIEDTILSVLKQGYRNIEYIVIDGASTDNTVALLEDHRKRDARLSYVSEKDNGMYDAINKGLTKASGDILAYINSDDLYAPGVFEVVVAYFNSHPEVDVVYGDTLVANLVTGDVHVNLYLPRPETWLRAGGIIAQPTVFMRRRCWEEAGGFRRAVKYLGDCEYWLRLVERGFRFGKIDEVVAIELNHGETLRTTMADEIAREKSYLRQHYWPKRPLGELARSAVLLFRKVFTPFRYVRLIMKINRRVETGAWGGFIRHYRPRASLKGYLLNKLLRTRRKVWAVDVIKVASRDTARALHKTRILAIMPVHNRLNYTLSSLARLLGNKSSSYDLDALVVDDGSTDGTAERVAADFPGVRLEKGDGNLWWSGGVNVGLRYALAHQYDYVYLSNDDNTARENTLDELYRVAVADRRNICTSLVLNADGENILNAGLGYTGPLRKIRENLRGRAVRDAGQVPFAVDMIGSRSTLLPTACIREIGLFDARRFPQHYGDLEYFNRARENDYRLLVVPSSIVLTQENRNYLHNYIHQGSLGNLLRAYGDLRHPFHFKTIFFRCYVGRGRFRGTLMLMRELVVHGGWIILKALLPNSALRGIVASIK